tara:strand:- start:117 stop:281 length:165 start_codon:yes stop_codon:yes gene_type:complete
LLYASSVLKEAVAETLTEYDDDNLSALENCRTLDIATDYIFRLASWYRKKEGIE